MRPRDPSGCLLLRNAGAVAGTLLITAAAAPVAPARADNDRLNKSIVANVYTIHRQAGCEDKRVTINPALQLAAEWHTRDLMVNREIDDHFGSDGSSPQSRSAAAGFVGSDVAETVAVHPALAISGLELLRTWYQNPGDLAVMQNCDLTQMGVWSENSLDRTVVVAVYGKPAGGSPK